MGFLPTITSLLLVWNYPIFILPKQRELDLEAGKLMRQLRTEAIPSAPGDDAGRGIGKLLAVQIETTHITTAGTAVVALAVGLLGLGSLTLLTVVILNRRVSLNQIDASLKEISRQLRDLQEGRGSP